MLVDQWHLIVNTVKRKGSGHNQIKFLQIFFLPVERDRYIGPKYNFFVPNIVSITLCINANPSIF